MSRPPNLSTLLWTTSCSFAQFEPINNSGEHFLRDRGEQHLLVGLQGIMYAIGGDESAVG